MINSTIIPCEEIKNQTGISNSMNKYIHPLNQKDNPLLKNKGSIRKDKSEDLAENYKKECKKEEPLEIPEEENEIVKKSSSIESCDELSIGNSERSNNNVLLMFQIPIFETHKSSTAALSDKNKGPPVPEGVSQINIPEISTEFPTTFIKSKTVRASPTPIEKLAGTLTPKQYEYLKAMYDFKETYISHALNNAGIMGQYVAMSKADLSFTKSKEFLKREEQLLQWCSGKYNRDPNKYDMNLKTLVLDLDETIIISSPELIDGYNLVILPSDVNDIEGQVLIYNI